MGTSDGYGGSGGAWNGAQRERGDLLSGGDATPEDVCGDAAGALAWGDTQGDGSQTDGGVDDASTDPEAGPPVAGSIGPIRIGGRRSGAGVGGGSTSVGRGIAGRARQAGG